MAKHKGTALITAAFLLKAPKAEVQDAATHIRTLVMKWIEADDAHFSKVGKRRDYSAVDKLVAAMENPRNCNVKTPRGTYRAFQPNEIRKIVRAVSPYFPARER